jgi:hypothetical protein
MTYPEPLDRRPVDKIWPARQESADGKSCSIGHHPVTLEEYNSWTEIDRREFNISRCCPTCWDRITKEADEEIGD